MDIVEYFNSTNGRAVLATSDSHGKVNAAAYSKPHFMKDGLIALIMLERLTHHNLLSNPYAAYAFKEDENISGGVRLYLLKIREEKNSELLNSLKKTSFSSNKRGNRYLVFFKIEKILPLVGSDQSKLPFEVPKSS